MSFVRPRGFTHDIEDVAAIAASRTDTTTIASLLRLDQDAIGSLGVQVDAGRLDPEHLGALMDIAVQEVSWCKIP